MQCIEFVFLMHWICVFNALSLGGESAVAVKDARQISSGTPVYQNKSIPKGIEGSVYQTSDRGLCALSYVPAPVGVLGQKRTVAQNRTLSRPRTFKKLTHKHNHLI